MKTKHLTAGLLFSICILFFCQIGLASPLFYPRVNYPAGVHPRSVAIGDLDGDGDLDLVVATYGEKYVSVLLNNGDGTFQAAVKYGVGMDPISVAIGDLDGDGDLDLAVANWASHTVSVLLGNGDGTFQARLNYETGGWPRSVAIGDLDDDGALDLALTSQWSNCVSLLLNNGDGTFQAPLTYRIGDLPTSVAIGDLDGDSDLDLVVANSDYEKLCYVSVLLNNGDGTFQANLNYRAGIGPASVAIGDLDGDGDLDLAVANYNFDYPNECYVSVLLNNGDGTFQAAVKYGAGIISRSVAIGDLDGDGALDLALAKAFFFSISVFVLLGNGDGTFQVAENYLAGIWPDSVTIGDLDGDGYLDLAVANMDSNNVSVLINRSRCFIATAAYGSHMAEEVNILKDFREHVLLTNSFGKVFVKFYYKVSPPLADFISKHESLRAIARLGLYPLIGISWVALKIGTANVLLLLVLLGFGLMALGKYRSKLWQVYNRT
jgi:hypothetical protein